MSTRIGRKKIPLISSLDRIDRKKQASKVFVEHLKMTLIRSCLIRARVMGRSFHRFYANSATRTIDVHSIPHEPIESKSEQPFRTSITDPVGVFFREIVRRLFFLFFFVSAFTFRKRFWFILHSESG